MNETATCVSDHSAGHLLVIHACCEDLMANCRTDSMRPRMIFGVSEQCLKWRRQKRTEIASPNPTIAHCSSAKAAWASARPLTSSSARKAARAGWRRRTTPTASSSSARAARSTRRRPTRRPGSRRSECRPHWVLFADSVFQIRYDHLALCFVFAACRPHFIHKFLSESSQIRRSRSHSLAVSGDFLVAYGCGNGCVRLLRPASGLVKTLGAHDDKATVTHVVVSGGGRAGAAATVGNVVVVSAAVDGSIKVRRERDRPDKAQESNVRPTF